MVVRGYLKKDIFCSCGYNLRELRINGRCPECGQAILAKITIDSGLPVNPAQRADAIERRLALSAAAIAKGYPPEAIDLVRQLFRFVAELMEPGVSISAKGLCNSLREFALLKFDTPAKAIMALASRKIRRSEDLGMIIYLMVETGNLYATDEDSQADFNGLFKLENLFEPTL